MPTTRVYEIHHPRPLYIYLLYGTNSPGETLSDVSLPSIKLLDGVSGEAGQKTVYEGPSSYVCTLSQKLCMKALHPMYVHCPKNNLNLRLKTEPVTVQSRDNGMCLVWMVSVP